ncbi:MAG: hypothetical protein RLY93_09960 [Sumerlaeia bacterium]
MKFAPLIPVLAVALTQSVGCTNTKVHRLTTERFEPAANPESVRLFIGPVNRPHTRIAYVNSDTEDMPTVVEKRAQLKELQARAAKLGADAVVEIELLQEEHKGFVPDPAVPFKAWRQGEYELAFLRGTAIKFRDDATTATLAEAVAQEVAADTDAVEEDLSVLPPGFEAAAPAPPTFSEGTRELNEDADDAALEAIPAGPAGTEEDAERGGRLNPAY